MKVSVTSLHIDHGCQTGDHPVAVAPLNLRGQTGHRKSTGHFGQEGTAQPRLATKSFKTNHVSTILVRAVIPDLVVEQAGADEEASWLLPPSDVSDVPSDEHFSISI